MKYFLLLIFLSLTSSLYPQYLLTGKEIFTFEDLPKKIELVKRSSASIEKYFPNKNEYSLIGSSFIVIKNGNHYAVTNYHVIKGQANLIIGLNASGKKQYFTFKEIYLDTIHDIAVLKFDKGYERTNSKIDTTLTDPASIGISMFENTNNIKEGTGAIIVGYPMTLGAKYTGNKPVSRIGIVAQEPNLETGTFLLDGLANHGNSGSPVFNEQNQKLMGMVTSFRTDYIKSADTLITRYLYNSGITICVTAETISKIIQ
jgi:S1-C subfamily serine protease